MNAPPLVTVDCTPVENRELDQLLGINRGEEGKRSAEEEMITLDDEEEEGDGEEEEEVILEQEGREQLEQRRHWHLSRALVEFLLVSRNNCSHDTISLLFDVPY